jgi:hypothetical protein
VLGLRARSELAYEELDRRYRATIERVALKCLDRHDFPDAIQQVLLKVFANIHQFRRESSLKRWILQSPTPKFKGCAGTSNGAKTNRPHMMSLHQTWLIRGQVSLKCCVIGKWMNKLSWLF